MTDSINTFLVASFNRYLSCDPERAQALQAIDGKVLGLTLKELQHMLYMQVSKCTLQVVNETVDCDAEIIISVNMLTDKLAGADQNQILKNGSIEIQGDSHIASVFNNVLQEVEIDWQDILSQYTGDVIAHQLATGAEVVHGMLKNLRENARLDLRDYLQDDLQVAVTQGEVDHFIQQVDELRARTDRLEARLKKHHK